MTRNDLIELLKEEGYEMNLLLKGSTKDLQQELDELRRYQRIAKGKTKVSESAPQIPGFAKVCLSSGPIRFIKIMRETDSFIIGKRVNEDGSIWSSIKGGTHNEEMIVVRPSEVVMRMVLNTHYGKLEKE